jgi:hypothetical protein
MPAEEIRGREREEERRGAGLFHGLVTCLFQYFTMLISDYLLVACFMDKFEYLHIYL